MKEPRQETAPPPFVAYTASGALDETVSATSEYAGSSDIAFNPARSLNCQAHAAALYVSLRERGLLTTALSGAA